MVTQWKLQTTPILALLTLAAVLRLNQVADCSGGQRIVYFWPALFLLNANILSPGGAELCRFCLPGLLFDNLYSLNFVAGKSFPQASASVLDAEPCLLV